MPYHTHILWRVTAANPAGIFVKDNIQYPMQTLFDAPVATYQIVDGRGSAPLVEEVVALLDGRCPVHRVLGFDQRHARQVTPLLALVQVGQCIRVTDDIGRARLHASVPRIGSGRAGQTIFLLASRSSRTKES